jgi:hypothetical protein
MLQAHSWAGATQHVFCSVRVCQDATAIRKCYGSLHIAGSIQELLNLFIIDQQRYGHSGVTGF